MPSEDEAIQAPPQLARTARGKGKVVAKTSKVRDVIYLVKGVWMLALLMSV